MLAGASAGRRGREGLRARVGLCPRMGLCTRLMTTHAGEDEVGTQMTVCVRATGVMACTGRKCEAMGLWGCDVGEREIARVIVEARRVGACVRGIEAACARTPTPPEPSAIRVVGGGR